MVIDGNKVTRFQEKPQGDTNWINGGFFVCEPDLMDYIEGDETLLEQEPLQNLAKDGKLGAFKHEGFWHPIDTLRDKNNLNELWEEHQAPWKKW